MQHNNLTKLKAQENTQDQPLLEVNLKETRNININ